MRRTYSYEFELCEALFEGTYTADCGYVDSISLPDGTEVEINLDLTTIDRGQGDEALTLARLIARRIVANRMCQTELDQTKPYESWAGYAPVVL